MIRKPQYKTARRLGDKLFPKTQTQKFSIRAGRKKLSKTGRMKSKTEYGLQFLEKQKVKVSYGMLEKQFAKYVREAREHSRVNPAQGLYVRLESRLDNVVYRMGVATSRSAARQLVSHGHILVNGKRTNVPSRNMVKGDVVGIREASKKSALFGDLVQKLKNNKPPEWLQMDEQTGEARMQAVPLNTRGEASLNFNAVIELYSRA